MYPQLSQGMIKMDKSAIDTDAKKEPTPEVDIQTKDESQDQHIKEIDPDMFLV